MLLILTYFYQQVKKFDQLCYRDPRTLGIPLVGAPWPILSILGVYLLFVLKVGPELMANRKPFKLHRVMQVYNAVQVAVNAYVCVFSFLGSYCKPYFSWTCQGYDTNFLPPGIDALITVAKVGLASKIMDVLDTVFFVLRKKQNQVSFLHVYHHSMMILGAWAYLTFFFGNHFTMTGPVNSFVHVVMYSYYFVSSLKLNIDLSAWKKRITQLQLVQFLFFVYHYAMPLINNHCGLNNIWTAMCFVQNLFILVLFCDFYYKAYVAKGSSSRAKPAINAVKRAAGGVDESLNLNTLSKVIKVQ